MTAATALSRPSKTLHKGQNRNHESNKQGTGVSPNENGRMVVRKETSDGHPARPDDNGQREEIGAFEEKK